MRTTIACVWLATAALLRCTHARIGWLPRVGRFDTFNAHPGVPNCTAHTYTQRLDHFNYAETRTWRQRYFTHDSHFDEASSSVLFYVGNEANVELYVNSTGLMCDRNRPRPPPPPRPRLAAQMPPPAHAIPRAWHDSAALAQVGAREGATRPSHLRGAPLLRGVAATRSASQ